MPRSPQITDRVFSERIVILSGHGCLLPQTSGSRTSETYEKDREKIKNLEHTIRVPVGFTVTVWARTRLAGAGDPEPDGSMMLDDETGTLIDSGQFVQAFGLVHRAGDTPPLPITFDAKEEIPNLMILPPRNNRTGRHARLHTVDRPGTLADFLANLMRTDPNGVNLHWSACSELLGRGRLYIRVDEKTPQANAFDVAKTHYWSK